MSDIENPSSKETKGQESDRKSLLEFFDLFAVLVASTYNGKQSHPTKCGGFLSILYSFSLGMFFFSRIYIWLGKKGDEFS